MSDFKFEPHLQKSLDGARDVSANTDQKELLIDFLAFEDDIPSKEAVLFNKVLDEYKRITGEQWRYWDNNEYEFCVHLMNGFGIGAKLVTDATWYAEVCHGGSGEGYNVMEAVFNAFLMFAGYEKDLGWKL